MSTTIHPTAVVDPQARLGEGVSVGPNAIIEAGVTVGDRCAIGPLVHIQGITEIGPDNRILTGAVIGLPPQHLGYNNEPTRLVIGARNWIREYVSIHRAYKVESETRIGDDCLLMGFSHVAHDCVIGNRVIIANGAVLGGHVTVGDQAFISGNVAVHQFCRIGRLAMISGLAGVNQDVPPFCLAEGHKAHIRGLNVTGLRRANIDAGRRSELKRLLKAIYNPHMTLAETLATLHAETEDGRELLEFYRTSQRGVAGFSLAKYLGSGGQAAAVEAAD
jgi:UDP-N-acetylglucosamine acyltransferase